MRSEENKRGVLCCGVVVEWHDRKARSKKYDNSRGQNKMGKSSEGERGYPTGKRKPTSKKLHCQQ